jgi:hypothetical protein
MTVRGRQTKSRRARVRDPFTVWKDHVRAEQDPDRRDLLIEAGKDAGYCDRRGRIIDPNITPEQRGNATMNDSIRRAAGRTPRDDAD